MSTIERQTTFSVSRKFDAPSARRNSRTIIIIVEENVQFPLSARDTRRRDAAPQKKRDIQRRRIFRDFRGETPPVGKARAIIEGGKKRNAKHRCVVINFMRGRASTKRSLWDIFVDTAVVW